MYLFINYKRKDTRSYTWYVNSDIQQDNINITELETKIHITIVSK